MKGLLGLLLLFNAGVALYFVLDPGVRQGPGEESLHAEKMALRNEAALSPASPPAAPAAVQGFCIEWRGLSREELVRAREDLKRLVNERILSFSEQPASIRHWVIFPPLPSEQAAAQKLRELTSLGLNDAFVVKDPPWRYAISLGLYANTEAAARRTREVEALGVLGTRVESLPRQGTDYYFLIESADPDTLKSLSDMGRAYPDSRQSRVACPS